MLIIFRWLAARVYARENLGICVARVYARVNLGLYVARVRAPRNDARDKNVLVFQAFSVAVCTNTHFCDVSYIFTFSELHFF